MATESSKTDVYMMSTVRGLVEYITAKTQLAQNAAPTLAPRSPTLATGAAILGKLQRPGRNRAPNKVLDRRLNIVLQDPVHLMVIGICTAFTNHSSYCQVTLTEALGLPCAALGRGHICQTRIPLKRARRSLCQNH